MREATPQRKAGLEAKWQRLPFLHFFLLYLFIGGGFTHNSTSKRPNIASVTPWMLSAAACARSVLGFSLSCNTLPSS